MNVNFIVCDDDTNTLKKVKNIISKEMMRNNIEYQTYAFDDYNDEFMKMINSPILGKIYILDIEAPSRSGLDIARIIRQKDINSVIIFLTNHEELGLSILKSDLMFLSFINKLDDCENKMILAIRKALKLLDCKNIVRFCDNGVHFCLNIDEVLYVTRDTTERKSIIKTVYTEFKTHKSLSYLEDLFGEKFMKTHKSCIVNTDRVVCVNKHKGLIKFNTGETIDYLSIKYKKDLIKIVK